jgi:hypothetical protein
MFPFYGGVFITYAFDAYEGESILFASSYITAMKEMFDFGEQPDP